MIEDPAAIVPIEHWIVPPFPGAGVVQPAFGFSETNVIVPGNVSNSITEDAGLAEKLVTVIVYVTFVHGPAAVGPVLVTPTSGCGAGGVDVPAIELLFSTKSSGVLLLIVAVF